MQEGTTDRIHRFDVFSEGDKVPWGTSYVTVLEREVVESLPDELPKWMLKDRDIDGGPFAVLTLEHSDEGVKDRALATAVAREMRVEFGDGTDLPFIYAQPFGPAGRDAVEVHAGGDPSVLEPGDAIELAEYLAHRGRFPPVHAVIPGAGDQADLDDLADALERAAEVITYADKIEG